MARFSRHSRSAALLLAVLGVSLFAGSAQGCMWSFGKAPDSLAPPKGGKPFDFAMQGVDWDEGDCAVGTEQSPIDFVDGNITGAISSAPRTTYSYPDLVSDGETLVVMNTGFNIQVQWDGMVPEYEGTIGVPHRGEPDSTVHDVLAYPPEDMTAMAVGKPTQFHFHTKSEHTMGGTYYPLEMHIVNVIPESEMAGCDVNCIAPVGVMFKEVEEGDNPVLEQILAHASMREGEVTVVPEGESIDLSQLIPGGGEGAYLQYKGGLTTPPCSEGFLWHVFVEPSYVSRSQLERFMELMSFKTCELKATPTDGDASPNGGAANRFMLPSEQIMTRSTIVSELPEGERNPEDFECKMAAWGHNNRRVMPQNNRTVMRYE